MRRRAPAQILPLMAILIMALFVVTGLALDGGQVLVARQEVQGIADAAARSGAEQLDERSVRSGDASPRIDPRAAYTAAANYVAIQPQGFTASVSTTPQQVAVQVSKTIPLTFMRLVGMNSATIEAIGTAEPRTGITQVGN